MPIQLAIKNQSLQDAYNYAPDAATKNIFLSIYLIELIGELMASFDELKANVAAEKTVVDSAVVAFKGLADKIAELKTLVEGNTVAQAAIDELSANVKAQSKELGDAVAAVPAA